VKGTSIYLFIFEAFGLSESLHEALLTGTPPPSLEGKKGLIDITFFSGFLTAFFYFFAVAGFWSESTDLCECSKSLWLCGAALAEKILPLSIVIESISMK